MPTDISLRLGLSRVQAFFDLALGRQQCIRWLGSSGAHGAVKISALNIKIKIYYIIRYNKYYIYISSLAACYYRSCTPQRMAWIECSTDLHKLPDLMAPRITYTRPLHKKGLDFLSPKCAKIGFPSHSAGVIESFGVWCWNCLRRWWVW